MPFNKELKQTVLTPQGYEKVKNELSFLKEVRLRDILDKLSAALESERALLGNTAYEQAFNEKELVESRIDELSRLLPEATVSLTAGNSEQVGYGSTVSLQIDGDVEVYTVVNSLEVESGKISHESPLGKGLLGRSVGSEVVVEVPAGKLIYKILKII